MITELGRCTVQNLAASSTLEQVTPVDVGPYSNLTAFIEIQDFSIGAGANRSCDLQIWTAADAYPKRFVPLPSVSVTLSSSLSTLVYRYGLSEFGEFLRWQVNSGSAWTASDMFTFAITLSVKGVIEGSPK